MRQHLLERALAATLFLGLLAGPGLPAWAAGAPQPLVTAARSDGISQNEAARLVAARTGGRVLSAQTVRGDDGRTVYLIRVLLDKGRVRVYQVDARTGRIQ